MEKHLFTSESVTEGHPDKMCDAISDAVLDALMEQDPMSRVACETCTTTGLVLAVSYTHLDVYKRQVFGGSSDEKFMQHCKEDPDSVLAGVQAIADTLEDWAEGFLEAGADGLYYSGQFSEPGRFTEEEWEKLVKPFDLQILNRVHCHEEKYNIVHICGEEMCIRDRHYRHGNL